LDDWVRNGWLHAHQATREEVHALLVKVDRDLRASGTEQLDADWRFAIAYQAALGACSIALLAAGYQPAKGESGHYRTIESLSETIGAEPSTVRRLDAFRKKRNISSYETAGTISDREGDDVRKLAQQLRDQVVEWLRKEHPNLLND
jgi:hypothetical protein